MKRRYQMLLRAPLLAVILFGAGSPIAWFGDSVSAASTVQAVCHTGILVVTGTDADDAIVVSANSTTGNLIVTNNDVIVPINVVFGSTNRANMDLVVVLGGDGNDSIALDNSLNNGASNTLGPTPNATLIGGRGDDTLTSDFGGFNGAVVNGTVTGTILGNVVLDGGDGDDILNSGFGNDVMLGGNGNDTLRWRPGDLNDTFDGGEGLDTAEIIGNENLGEAYVIGIDPNQPDQALVQRTSFVKFFVQIQNIEAIALSTRSGNDTITINDLTRTGVQSVRVNGGAGNDVLNGAAQTNASVELALDGEDGNDSLVGGAGPDVLTGGAGSDILRGGDGADTILANDGQRDLITCGGGTDKVFVDPRGDLVSTDCEVVNTP